MCVLMCNFVSYFVCVILCIFVFLCDILLPSGVINDDDICTRFEFSATFIFSQKPELGVAKLSFQLRSFDLKITPRVICAKTNEFAEFCS